MPTTINNTLPLNWDSSYTYSEKDTVSYGGIIYVSIVNNNLNNIPKNNLDYWKPLDIYIKDLTVMPHGNYSGDESFWERDNIYIDTNGWVYINNENTGINVRGRDASTVTFEDLTPEQREQLRGPRGYQGATGPQGPQGPQGPMGEVVLTPEQIAVLTGPAGASTYQIWLDAGYTGTEEDFLNWVRTSLVQYDTKLLPGSTNAVENQAIYNALFSYQIYLTAQLELALSRVTNLENRLKYTYNNEDCLFRFGITENNEYGYIKQGSDVVTPFSNYTPEVQESSSVFPGPLATATEIGIQEYTQADQIMLSNFSESVNPTALQGTPSISNDNDNANTIYGSNVEITTLDDYTQ